MRMSIFIGLLLINGCLGGVIDAPNCNYAAIEDLGFFPIEGCYKTRAVDGNTVSYTAYKYQCRGGNAVYKLEYEGEDYCDGTPVIEQPVTAQLSGYQCDLDICPYGEACAYSDCAACDETCVANPDTASSIVCSPKIVDSCVGQTDSTPNDNFQLFRLGTCVNGVLTDDFYGGVDGNTCADVSGSDPLISPTFTGCQWGTYYTSSCHDALDSPSCNYVAHDFQFDAIGACHKKRRYKNKACTEYEAFKYECNGDGSLIKYYYQDDTYCDGEAVREEDVTNAVQRYECDGNPCKVAEQCDITGCVKTDGEGNPDCSNCPTLGRLASKSQRVIKNANVDCKQVILDDCFGNGGVSQLFSCRDNNRDRKSDTLSDNVYFGDPQCAAAPLITDVYGGDNDCSATRKRTVSCDTDNFITAGDVENPITDDFNDNHNENNNNNNNIGDNGNVAKFIETLTGLSLFETILLLTNILTISICLCICGRYVICNKKRNRNDKYSKAVMFDEEQQSLHL